MGIASRKICILAVFLVVNTGWAFGKSPVRVAAADGPKHLEPIPGELPPVAQPSTSGPKASANSQPQPLVQEDELMTTSFDEGQCEEFCSPPICSPPGRLWLRADYLMWWTSGMNLPALVTTGTQVDPAETVLFGNGTVNTSGRSGYQTTVGMWLGNCHVWGVEFDYLNLGQRAANYSQASTGDPILTRPFFNVEENIWDSELVAYPGAATGSISVRATDQFQSAGVLWSYNLCASESCCNTCGDPCGDCGDCCDCSPRLCCCRTDLLAGFRYYTLNDSVAIHENVDLIQLATNFDIHDNFAARNDFYGSEVGLRTRLYRGRWSLDILGKVAIGNTHETVTISGQTVRTTAERTTVYDAGILALANPPANIGTYQRDVFTMIPQLKLELGYQLTCCWRAYAGYSVLYWGSVARSGDQIDLYLDPRNFPGQSSNGLPFPSFSGNLSPFWAHGVNVGLERRF